jgi:uncharacterized NAD(P)/FAD-binding protein YdhS
MGTMVREDEAVCAGTDASRQGVPTEHFDLAIVGGGFSGLCCAYHLLTHGGIPPSFRCAIIEPNERLGAGIAYRTDSPHHLLNVRARGMSMTENDTGSFIRWLREEAPHFSPDDFVPRGLYRRYTNACLTLAIEQRPGMLSVLRDEVLSVESKGTSPWYRLRLRSGMSLHAGSVVLAIGNIPPKGTLDNGLLRCPWTAPFDGYRHARTMAIVGAGLTAVDVILEAEASGFSGQCWVISPHGQFPREHREPHVPVPQELREWAAELAASRPTLRRMLRAFQVKRRAGFTWEHLVDSLRRYSPALWNGFDLRDKRCFLRRFRSLWNTHLHRSCRRSMQLVSRLMESGRLKQIAARVTGIERLEGKGEYSVRLLLKSEAIPTLDVDVAFNGTGLFSDILRTESPLVDQLIRDKLARPDELRLGLQVNGNGQLISADGVLQPELFAIGTLRRGEELECTAVPEIRKQVLRMVEEIVGMMVKQ